MLKTICCESAPKAIGPYSQAIVAGDFVFVSGQIPIDPKSGELLSGSVAEETRQSIKNIAAILETAGASLAQVVKTTVYLKDMNDFEAMNNVYAEYFAELKPARATVQVAKLPKDVRVEIDAIAHLKNS